MCWTFVSEATYTVHVTDWLRRINMILQNKLKTSPSCSFHLQSGPLRTRHFSNIPWADNFLLIERFGTSVLSKLTENIQQWRNRLVHGPILNTQLTYAAWNMSHKRRCIVVFNKSLCSNCLNMKTFYFWTSFQYFLYISVRYWEHLNMKINLFGPKRWF